MRLLFFRQDTEAVLLVYVSNAFNSLNRQVALRNIQHLCPSLANILINSYTEPTELFVDGQVLWSEEGTTHGDPLAMPMYALATIPLIDQLAGMQDIIQVWYADDASAAGSLPSIRAWWDRIESSGPAFGYHANACKMWLVVKEQYLSKAKELFKDTDVNITSRGRLNLGFPHRFRRVYRGIRDQESSGMVRTTARADQCCHHPTTCHLYCLCAWVYTYLSRTTLNIDHLLQRLEDIIQSHPCLDWKGPSECVRA